MKKYYKVKEVNKIKLKTYITQLFNIRRLMKKHYKTKPKNITKLKTYINAIKTDNKGSRRSVRGQHSNPKYNNLH